MHHAATMLCAAVCLIALMAPTEASARPKLENTCGGGIAIDFVRKCDKHADKGYVPLRRQVSGSCMDMCCQQDKSGGIVCTSDPDSITERTGMPRHPVEPAASAVAPAPAASVPNKR